MRLLPDAVAIAAVLSAFVAGNVAAQSAGRDRDDGAAVRTDAILATPNRVTPVPQTNMFSTSHGLTQQTPVLQAPAATDGRQDGDRRAPADRKPR